MSGAAKAALAGKSGLVARTGLVARAGLVLDHGAEGALLLADGLRSGVYRAFGRRLARFFRDREVRVAWFAGIAVTMGALLAVSAPLWLLALGPILLGVPHVVGDVRYLWTQPGYHKNKRVWLLVGPALLVGAVTADVGWGLAAALLALWALPASTQRRMAGAVVLVPLLVLSFVWRSEARLLFAHLHNLIALALWCIYRPRTRRFHWGVLAGVGAISLLILLGAADGASLSSSPDGRTMNFYGASLAPFASPVWAWRLRDAPVTEGSTPPPVRLDSGHQGSRHATPDSASARASAPLVPAPQVQAPRNFAQPLSTTTPTPLHKNQGRATRGRGGRAA